LPQNFSNGMNTLDRWETPPDCGLGVHAGILLLS
jgi:hypothetical protein